MTEGSWPKSDGDILYASEVDKIKGIGDGTDGAFSESTGDTVLTQGVVYQYTSFSMTGDATISTTKTTGEPIIILVQGNLTISSSGTCDFQGYGEDAPTGTSNNVVGGGTTQYTYSSYTNGAAGTFNSSNAIGAGGNPPSYMDLVRIKPNYVMLPLGLMICSGTKGANGQTAGAATVGVGGSGGASLIFYVGGTASISNVTFNMSGANAVAASGGGVDDIAQGGGGGGSGSIFILSIGALTDTGTYSVDGGTASISSGSGSVGNPISPGSGGASLINKANNTTSIQTASGGSDGGDGLALRTQLQ